MEVIALQSGSNGNSYFVQAGDVRLMFDAGISGRAAEQRLALHGRDIRTVDALFITHDHIDHSRSMGVFNRRFGMPIYLTAGTLDAARRWHKVGELNDVHCFTAGEVISFGDVHVHSIPTPHDGADAVVYIIEHDEKRIGILTDLGHVFDGLREVLLSLDAVVIESNYDPDMLENGFYPERLKKRIKGRGGHISNHEAAKLLRDSVFFKRLKWACLCHLSDENNCPDVAVETHRRLVGNQIPIHVASRHGVSDVFEI